MLIFQLFRKEEKISVCDLAHQSWLPALAVKMDAAPFLELTHTRAILLFGVGGGPHP